MAASALQTFARPRPRISAARIASSPPGHGDIDAAEIGQRERLPVGQLFLLNGDGARTGGTIMFDIFYEMTVATPGSSPTNFSQTTLNLVSSGGGVNTSFGMACCRRR
jgi:hypothetical protein